MACQGPGKRRLIQVWLRARVIRRRPLVLSQNWAPQREVARAAPRTWGTETWIDTTGSGKFT